MIRVLLKGRIGNSFFQYAAGRAVAVKQKAELVLDGSWMDDAHARAYENLLRLPIKARYERRLSAPKRLCRRLFGSNPEAFHQGPVIIDPDDGTQVDVSNAQDGSLLVGFFQSPAYVESIAPQIREELDLSRISIPDSATRFEDTIRTSLTASIHVRRGDYLGIGNTQCLDGDYHERAVDWFRQRYEGIRFCVFSDDIPWCRTRFTGSDFLFCDFPAAGDDPLHDMRLMTSCHHHVIANSSYSWWGAWLNSRKDKQVIAPRQWMRGISSENIVPVDWHKF